MPGTSLSMDPAELHYLGVLATTATSLTKRDKCHLNTEPRREKDEMAHPLSPSKQVSSVSQTREAATGWGIQQVHQTCQCNLMQLSKGKGTRRKGKKEEKAIKALLHKLREESLCLGLASPCSWDQTQAGKLTQDDALAPGGP